MSRFETAVISFALFVFLALSAFTVAIDPYPRYSARTGRVAVALLTVGAIAALAWGVVAVR